MRKNLLTLGVVAVAILLATSASAANRGVEFTGIGFHPADIGQSYTPASAAYNLSADGSIIMASPTPWGNYCFMWNETDGWHTEVGEAGSLCWVTNDGQIGGDGPNYDIWDYNPGYWAGQPNVWDLIDMSGFDSCGSTLSTHGASDNLDYLVGLGWEGCRGRRFIHDRNADTTEVLPCIGAWNGSCRYNDISNDGGVAVGWNSERCGAWRGAKDAGDGWEWIDGLGDIEKKLCTSGGGCCGNSDCPEFVDAYCDEQCIDGFCGPGPNEGNACTSNWQCDGYCVNGPNHGQECTSSYYCPDVDVCLDNPAFDPEIGDDWKGEGYRVTPDGDYILGYNYGNTFYNWQDPNFDPELFAMAYRQNPDGSFTPIPIPPGASPYDSWTPLHMSDDGNVVVGRYGWWIYSFPVVWTPYTGTLDLQYFLIAQGLDELWFWYLSSANQTSGDGHTIVGYGSVDPSIQPDCNSAWGCQEGFVIDISKVKVCHKPGDHNERTLTIALESAGDHLGHGDFLGTCEFKNSGGNARWAEQRASQPTRESAAADSNPMIIRADEAQTQIQQWAPRQESGQSERPRTERIRVQRSR